MELVIDTQGLSKTFGKVDALKSLHLKVPKNSIFGFLGPNGAGKTTTIKLLLGLIRPTAGSASIFGLNSERDTVAIRAHRVSPPGPALLRVHVCPGDPRLHRPFLLQRPSKGDR